MEWNLKMPTWDMTEFEQGTIPIIEGYTTGSSSYEPRNGDFSVDLKLGQVGEIDNKKVSKMELSPSSSTKRARAVNTSPIQNVSCLVDGCNADLSNCRDYHRRHKVCEVHSKTPQVTINGHKQRFCQQCSRFHSLQEFDEGKRSCRKRLDGHNRRRRKPQPEPVLHAGSLFSCQQGTTMLQFSNPPQVYQATSVTNQLWPSIVKSEEDSNVYNMQLQRGILFPQSSSSSNKGSEKQFSLFHNTNIKLNKNHLSPKLSQPFLTISSSETSSSSDKMFCCDGFPPPRVQSDSALSLLSSSPTQTSCISLTRATQPYPVLTTDSLGPGLRYTNLEPMQQPMMVANGSAGDSNVNCQGIFHMMPHAPRDNEIPQTLPFYWE